MSDEWVKEAERRSDEAVAYSEWIEQNEDYILQAYIESLEINDVPDDFIQSLYETQMQDR
jgi:hypothetical protein